MRLMVTGHRREKLAAYDEHWIRLTLLDLVKRAADDGYSLGLSGMASGVDLWFCEACLLAGVPYHACVPFDGQGELMSEGDAAEREKWLRHAARILKVRNRHMVEACDAAVVVWDGNKGGTHNCVQQLIEAGKPFWWLIPNQKKVVSV